MKIVFDMDGTIADLYGADEWLAYLEEEDTTPFREAEPLLDLDRLADVLAKCEELGYEIEVVSWLVRGGSREYDMRVRSAKQYWLKKNLPFKFSAIHIVKYGTDKSNYCADFGDILFDDNEEVRNGWLGQAYEPSEIFTVLESLVK